jgi:hypothetical protein
MMSTIPNLPFTSNCNVSIWVKKILKGTLKLLFHFWSHEALKHTKVKYVRMTKNITIVTYIQHRRHVVGRNINFKVVSSFFKY